MSPVSGDLLANWSLPFKWELFPSDWVSIQLMSPVSGDEVVGNNEYIENFQSFPFN